MRHSTCDRQFRTQKDLHEPVEYLHPVATALGSVTSFSGHALPAFRSALYCLTIGEMGEWRDLLPNSNFQGVRNVAFCVGVRQDVDAIVARPWQFSGPVF